MNSRSTIPLVFACILPFACSPLVQAEDKVYSATTASNWNTSGAWKLANGDNTSFPTTVDDVVGSKASSTNTELNGNFDANSINLQSSNTTAATWNIRARNASNSSLTVLTTLGLDVSNFNLNFTKTDANTMALSIGDTTHQGAISVTSGNLAIGGFSDATRLDSFSYTGPSTPITTVASNGTLSMGYTNAVGTDSSYNLGHGVIDGIVYLNRLEGFVADAHFASLSGSGTVYGARVEGDNGSDLTINQSKNTTFSGTLGDNTTVRGLSLTKAGEGTLELSGASTYTGGTTVGGGELQVTNLTGSGLGSGSVTVENGGTLSGTGFITLDVSESFTVADGGSLMAGAGEASGVLTIDGDMTFADGSVITIALGALGASSELARGDGAWAFSSDQTISFLNLGAEATLYENILTGLASDPGVSSWTIANAGWSGNFVYDSGSIDFNLTAIPEPRTVAVMFGVLAGLCFICTKRMKAKGQA